MTNEKKAEELAKGFGIDYYAKGSRHPIDHSFDECYKSALEMAEWKDQQFKEYLEKKKEQESHITGCPSYQYGRRRIIDEIIDELFGETEEVDYSNNDE